MNGPKRDPQAADPFGALASDDFALMLDVERYGSRSDTFDRFVAQTHAHFWDPTDPAYIAFDVPFDMEHQTVMPTSMVPELQTAVADRLSESDRIRFANESARWWLSSLLHGEQGALSLATSLCGLLRDPGAVEFAANQAREEARHVTAFARYIAARWGRPFAASHSLCGLLSELVAARDVSKKIVGMQLLVEGLAMGIFSVLHRRSNDPVLRRLTQLILVDEAFHHNAGKIWSEAALPKMTPAERDDVEDWALSCFQTVVSNLLHPEQKQPIYEMFGLQWQWVRDALREAYADKTRRRELADANSVFHPLVRSLLHAGVITQRTRHFYAVWMNLQDLANEGDDSSNDAIVADGIDYLKQINASRRRA